MKKYKFKAKIEAGNGGGAYVLFPYDTGKEFATNGKVPVKATFNGVSYTGSLIKYGKPLHVLGMPKAVRDQTGKGPGDTIEVVVWKDEAVRIVKVPAQFENLMKKEDLLPVFKKLSYTHRKEYCRWIAEAKKEETRLILSILSVRWVGKYEKKNRSSLEIVPCARFAGHPTKHHS
jgi:bifunctional DNA-binding transcriptional regulator/antitoxin component of YhaV-PrlF toxin-antitoxin module